MSLKHHVAAGTFVIEEQKPLILRAFLGTCVGVALYDTKARVCGLIHLLLPEPPFPESTYNLEQYASTGLPTFLRALLERGASTENLEACIAGGALIGPLDYRDIALDIGGRTADIVIKLLNREGIRIANAEIGGFFSCTLNLNAETFETSIVPAGNTPPFTTAKFPMPSPSDIRATMDNLQSIPQVALKILRLLDNNDCDIDIIASELRQDQVLAAKMLRLSNSSMFAGNVKIDSLHSAFLMLGRGLFIKTILSAAVETFYHQSDSSYSLCKGGLYHHAAGTAIISEKFALLTGKVSPATAYTAGLLHDIGMVVLDQYLTRSYPLFYRELQKENSNILALEKEFFGMNHCEVGRELATSWNLPAALADAIYYHHFPEKEGHNAALPIIVYVADLIMSRFHSGLGIERLDTEYLAQRMNLLGLSPTQIPELVNLIPLEVFSLP